MQATEYQQAVIDKVGAGESLLLVAPTGLGKTFAVTSDIEDQFCKIVYAVPLRALANDIQRSVSQYQRQGQLIKTAIHHGGIQESTLFGEDFVVTTYDQVVCAVPGLPLSLPLKSGHAVAGALLMSRLIFDEAHLAWGISKHALSIMLAIVQFRQSLGLQTILMTATLPDHVSAMISDQLGIERLVVDEEMGDQSLALRNQNKQVRAEYLTLGKSGRSGIDFTPLDQRLIRCKGKAIYFANTVFRLQQTYDRLVSAGLDRERIMVLHNRMPHQWRQQVEAKVKERFGKESGSNNWILLTNQVAEAGLDISAPLVISDPAPVDTLVQRAGRCSRWFRTAITTGVFAVLELPNKNLTKEYGQPYKDYLVESAIKKFKTIVESDPSLSWSVERQWVNDTWGKDEKTAKRDVQQALNETTFALNLFDRAAQERNPGQIANTFREILSIEVAVYDPSREDQTILADQLAHDLLPDTASISLKRASWLARQAGDQALMIRHDQEESQLVLESGYRVELGDILMLPCSLAYLHTEKGLCLVDESGSVELSAEPDAAETEKTDLLLSSQWHPIANSQRFFSTGLRQRQSLVEHTSKVMEGAFKRLNQLDSPYRQALVKIWRQLQPESTEQVTDLTANLARVAAAFHDLGKADQRWQERIRQIDPDCGLELVGRSLAQGGRIGIPHTPPGYAATVTACRLLLDINEDNHPYTELIRAIALASCRHHSSLLNPALVEDYQFQPHQEANSFVSQVLEIASGSVISQQGIDCVLQSAKQKPNSKDIPLILPNTDYFPIYALVGRAILMADREDASGQDLEVLA
jgi:CRISPR-associated endonuclease/helicase Cas3